ncbi:MAG TPA: dihydroxy-acid dehydratase, partial [Sphingomonas sp.]|nr:dihydroxy-acid dehydratase [Sphingomonas sp.]
VQTGDRIRIDLKNRTADMLVDDAELARRRAALEIDYVPEAQTPWQEIHRNLVGQFDGGAVFESAVKYQRIAQKYGVPRDSH